MSQQQKREVRTTARQLGKRRQITRILLIIVALFLLLMTVTYACTSILNKAGRFTINLDPEAFNKAGLSISSNKELTDKTIMLKGTAVEDMTNITQKWILNDPKDKMHYTVGDPTYKDFAEIDQVDGDHNGKNYIAYTFWITNSGVKDGGYYGSLDIDSVVKGADDAIRVMVFRNGEPTVYGKLPKAPEAEYAKFGIDKYFVSNEVVMEVKQDNFKVGDKDRYTIVIWLEGWDPECVDDIKGGEVKLSMNLKILEEETTTN